MIDSSRTLKRLAQASLLSAAALALSTVALNAQAPAAPAPAAPAAAPAPAPAAPPAEGTATLTIKVNKIRNAKGKLDIAVYNKADGFPLDTTGVLTARQFDIDPATLTVTAVFDKLPPGPYAVTVLHDEKMVGKMEFDGNGIPLEGYAVSNNPDSSQGPPTFDDAKVKVVDPGTAIEVTMVYWQ